MEAMSNRTYSKMILKRVTAGACGVLAGSLMVAPLEAATLTVINLNDSGAGSLRQCVLDANNGDDIVVDGALTGTIVLAGGAINLASDITLTGPGSSLLVVSGDHADRIFAATNVNTVINGLTFINGLADGLNGGVLNQEGGSVVFSNCLFLDNAAVGAVGQAGGFGGALYATGAVLSLQECVFSNNTAVGPNGLPLVASYSGGGGGGAGLGGALAIMGGTSVIAECVFGQNSVTGGVGGTAAWGSSTEDGAKGGGPAGGAGGVVGHLAGYEGGLFSGGGGGRIGSGTVGGNGGFGGGGGGSGAYNVGTVGGVGGQYGGDGSFSIYSAGGAGGGGAGLGGAIFVHNGMLVITNSLLAGNAAVGGAGGNAPQPGTNGMGAGGALFAHGSSQVGLFQASFSGNTANAYPDLFGAMVVLGTNSALIANGEGASVEKGTAMGGTIVGRPITNVFTLANNWTSSVAISSVTTNGAGASLFRLTGLPATVAAGTSTSFKVVFTPLVEGSYTCLVSMVNSSGSTPYGMGLSGTGLPKLNQVTTNMRPASGTAFVVTNTARLSAQASSGLAVSFQVRSGPATLSGGTNLTFSTSGRVEVVASQAGNDMWNPAPAVTGVYQVSKSSQAALVFAPAGSQVYRTTNTLSATGGSGTGAVTYAVVSGPGQIIGSNKLKVLSGTGTVRVRAVRGADARYHASAGVTAAVACVKAGQVLSFPAIPDQRRTNSVRLSASASSGLAVSYTVASGPGTISGGILRFSRAGQVRVVASQAGNTNFTAAARVTNSVNATGYTACDYAGAGSTAMSVYDPVGGKWYVYAQNGQVVSWGMEWGGPGMVPVNGDFDGDGISDPAVYDAANGKWYIRTMNDVVLAWGVAWGGAGMEPVPGDYDGDRATDLALYDAAASKWYIRTLNGTVLAWGVAWGGAGMNPVSGDYNGDEVSDLCVYDAVNGAWFATSGVRAGESEAFSEKAAGVIAWNVAWGGSGMTAVSGDFDGDEVFDLAVYHPGAGAWYVRSVSGTLLAWGLPWGGSGLIAVPGDFDGDLAWDAIVYRQSDGAWFAWSVKKQAAILANTCWGGAGLEPVAR